MEKLFSVKTSCESCSSKFGIFVRKVTLIFDQKRRIKLINFFRRTNVLNVSLYTADSALTIM